MAQLCGRDALGSDVHALVAITSAATMETQFLQLCAFRGGHSSTHHSGQCRWRPPVFRTAVAPPGQSTRSLTVRLTAFDAERSHLAAKVLSPVSELESFLPFSIWL